MSNDNDDAVFNRGWETVKVAITRLKNILGGGSEPEFTIEETMTLYTLVFNMCRRNWIRSRRVYNNYRETLQDYIVMTVMPCLKEKNGELMLKELVHRWSNHKIMMKKLSKFFYVLEVNYIPRFELPNLQDVGLKCFQSLVYGNLNNKFKEAVISLIDRKGKGEEIDGDLLTSVLDMFVEVGFGQMDEYENDFETRMQTDTECYTIAVLESWNMIVI